MPKLLDGLLRFDKVLEQALNPAPGVLKTIWLAPLDVLHKFDDFSAELKPS